jgi:putative oxidoreductase
VLEQHYYQQTKGTFLMLNGVLPASWSGTSHALLRVVAGLIFLQHGTAKLLGFPHIDWPADFPQAMIIVTGLFDLIGGALIIIGWKTRLVAFILSGFMAVAYFIGHMPQGFFPMINMGEAAILLCFIYLYFATVGAGPYSVDAMGK